MQNWYFAKDGKAQGPKTKQDIEAALRSGQITSEDLIFKEGEKEWKHAKQYPEFETVKHEPAPVAAVTPTTPAATASVPANPGSSPVAVGGEAKWVLLSRNWEDTQPGQPRYTQAGPFTRDQVIKKIESGEARWTDHVWSQGYGSWTRVSSLQEFNEGLGFEETKREFKMPGPAANVTPSSSPAVALQPAPAHEKEENTDTLLANVMKQVRNGVADLVHLKDEKPEGAVGESQTKSFGPALPTNVNSSAQATPAPVVKVEKAPDKALNDENTMPGTIEKTAEITINEVVDSKKAVRWASFKAWFTPKRVALYGGTFALIAVLLSFGLFFNPPGEANKHSKTEAEHAQQPPAPQAAPPPVVDAAPAPAPTAAVPAKPAVPEKKYVKIVPMKLDSATPQLVIESNAEVGEPIFVSVKGNEGQILDLVRFTRTLQLARTADQVPTVDLSKWALPQGTYSVEVKTNTVTNSAQIFIGQKNRQFQTQLEKHEKKLAIQRKSEKKDLEAELKRIETHAAQLQKNYPALKKNASKWAAFYKKWQKGAATFTPKGLVASYKPTQADRYIYSKTIEEIKGANAELVKTGKAFADSVKNKRAPASAADLKGLQQKIKQLKGQL